MKKDLTFIAVVLDESSSMADVQDATISGLNEFFKSQADKPGEAKVTLTKFSTYVSRPVFVDCDIKAVPQLNRETYRPAGMTALLDAVGQTIDGLGRRLAMMPEEERPGQVLVVIQTDGQENQSREYTLERVKSMIEHQKNVYNWGFIFMGQGIDSFATGGLLGIPAASTFDFSKRSTKSAYHVLDTYMTCARNMGHQNVVLSAADRSAAMAPDAP